MTIKQKIKALQDQLDALKREVAVEDGGKVWRPMVGEAYYAAERLGNISQWVWDNDEIDEQIYTQGRAFPTYEEAEKFLARERVTAEMRRIAEKHGGEPKAGTSFDVVAYDPDSKSWFIWRSFSCVRAGEVRFPKDTPAAQEARDTLDLDVFLED